MKYLVALLAVAYAQDEAAEGEAAAPGLAADADCKENPAGCDAGLCCAEAIYKEDIVDGQVSDSYTDNLLTICQAEDATEYANPDGEEYCVTCIPLAEGGATKLAAAAATVATALYMM